MKKLLAVSLGLVLGICQQLQAVEYYIFGRVELNGVHLRMYIPQCNCTLNGNVKPPPLPADKVGDWHMYEMQTSTDMVNWTGIYIFSVQNYDYFMFRYFSDEHKLFVRTIQIM